MTTPESPLSASLVAPDGTSRGSYRGTLLAPYSASTVRRARAAAKRAGHDMGRFLGGFDGPDARCRNEGCPWHLILRQPDEWVLVYRGPRPKPAGGRCPHSASNEIPPSDHLGACGHELDPWEAHLEHAPDCPRVLCLEDRCDCPEVCPDCCRSCGYDAAERSGS